MTDIREFTYHGEVRGQGRPRATTRGRHASVYKATIDREYEKAIMDAYLEEWSGLEPIQGAFKLELTIYKAIPESVSNKKKTAMMGKPCDRKPDIDNVQKSLLDALAGIAFINDKSCTDVVVRKRWSTCEGMTIILESLEED